MNKKFNHKICWVCQKNSLFKSKWSKQWTQLRKNYKISSIWWLPSKIWTRRHWKSLRELWRKYTVLKMFKSSKVLLLDHQLQHQGQEYFHFYLVAHQLSLPAASQHRPCQQLNVKQWRDVERHFLDHHQNANETSRINLQIYLLFD